MEDFAIIILGIIISLVASAKKKAKQEAANTKKVVYTAPAKKEDPKAEEPKTEENA